MILDDALCEEIMQALINSHSFFCKNDSAALIIFISGEEESAFIRDLMLSVEQKCRTSVSWLVYSVSDWNSSLSPWPADPVFGKEPFGGLSKDTLNDLIDSVIEIRKALGKTTEIPVILSGYSLAGLFALWTAYQTEIFTGVAAVSPSVWFPDWLEYSTSQIIHTDYVYDSCCMHMTAVK